MKFMFSYAVNVKLNIWTRARDVWERNKGKYVQRIGKSKSYSAMHKLLLWKLVRVNLRISPENMKLFPSTLFPITFGAAILYLLHVFSIRHTIHFQFWLLHSTCNFQNSWEFKGNVSKTWWVYKTRIQAWNKSCVSVQFLSIESCIILAMF